MKSAVTICLVPEAKAGPFVFHGDLAAGVGRAGEMGFDAVEVFPPYSDDLLDVSELRRVLADHDLRVSAIGTGAGWLVGKLTLVETDSSRKRQAMEFVWEVMDLAAQFNAPIIVGSMQGRHPEGRRHETLVRLADELASLGERAKQVGLPVLYEPLNRYETNLFTRQAQAADWLRSHRIDNVKILSDLFHMNIEETSLVEALLEVGDMLGHVHFVDSNRRAAGMGHIDFRPVIAALRDIHYTGYLSAEALPLPDADAAARQTLQTFKQLTTDN